MPSGTRIRTDNVFGTVTDNPLTNSATTLNSAGLANLAAVSGGHAVIILDPLRAGGAPEAVIVTAHTGSATSAPITRGAYGTSARQHAAGTLWVHAPTVEDFIRIVTSSTRPSDPYAGQLIFETDTDKFVGRNAANGAWVDAVPLGAWQPYTPSNTNVTVGNGTQIAQYTRVGRTVEAHYELLFGSTTAFTGTVAIGLPVQGAAYSGGLARVGIAYAADATGTFHTGNWRIGNNATSGSVTFHGQTASTGATVPFTWTTGDRLVLALTYQAAA